MLRPLMDRTLNLFCQAAIDSPRFLGLPKSAIKLHRRLAQRGVLNFIMQEIVHAPVIGSAVTIPSLLVLKVFLIACSASLQKLQYDQHQRASGLTVLILETRIK